MLSYDQLRAKSYDTPLLKSLLSWWWNPSGFDCDQWSVTQTQVRGQRRATVKFVLRWEVMWATTFHYHSSPGSHNILGLAPTAHLLSERNIFMKNISPCLHVLYLLLMIQLLSKLIINWRKEGWLWRAEEKNNAIVLCHLDPGQWTV